MELNNNMKTDFILWAMKSIRISTQSKNAAIAKSGGKIVDVIGQFLTALNNPETPAIMKAMILFCITYIISPIDFIPDIIPIKGWIDDFIIGGAALPLIASFSNFSLNDFDRMIGIQDTICENEPINPTTSISLKKETPAESEYIRLNDNDLDQLRKIKALYDEGILTETEYNQKKNQLLSHHINTH